MIEVDGEVDPKASASTNNGAGPGSSLAGFRGAREQGAEGSRSQPDSRSPLRFVVDFLDMLCMEVLFDGTLVRHGVPREAQRVETVGDVLRSVPVDATTVLDLMTIYVREHGYAFSRGQLKSGLNVALLTAQQARLASILEPLIHTTLSSAEREAVQVQWDLIAQLFNMTPILATAILKQFIWQVKQKASGRAVEHHLMPVIVSPVQGSGKTTFVKKLLGPLKETAADAALLTDFADRRSAEIYRFPVVVLDDLEAISPALVPILKGVVTAKHITRRMLHTSRSSKIDQKATLIGTANAPIQHLIPDETGHRRFVMMPFRNGQVEKGGSARIWEIVGSLDYELLWRSVDLLGTSPIAAHLEDLFRHQGLSGTESKVLRWLKSLDLQSEAVRRIKVRQGLKAQGLHHLFADQTGATISPYMFAKEMERCFHSPQSPIDNKIDIGSCVVYVLRSKKGTAVVDDPSTQKTSGVPGGVSPDKGWFDSFEGANHFDNSATSRSADCSQSSPSPPSPPNEQGGAGFAGSQMPTYAAEDWP